MKKFLLGFLSLGFVGFLVFGFSSCKNDEMDDFSQFSSSQKSIIPDDVVRNFAKKCDALIDALNKQEITVDSVENALMQSDYEIFLLYKENAPEMAEASSSPYKAPIIIDDGGATGQYGLCDPALEAVLKSTKEQQLEFIRKNTTPTFYILVSAASYDGILPWSNEEINEDQSMTNEEKYCLISTRTSLSFMQIQEAMEIVEESELPKDSTQIGVKVIKKTIDPLASLTEAQKVKYARCKAAKSMRDAECDGGYYLSSGVFLAGKLVNWFWGNVGNYGRGKAKEYRKRCKESSHRMFEICVIEQVFG